MENENPLEAKEKLEELAERRQGWTRYLAITTALIAVLAAFAALTSGNFANNAILKKNEAVLAQSQASDQYNFYEAKGIKKNLADLAYQITQDPQQQATSERYSQEQKTIKKTADADAKMVAAHNLDAEKELEKHHSEALAVTFFQIAIALSAMSALLDRKSFWAFSVGLSALGSYFLVIGLLR